MNPDRVAALSVLAAAVLWGTTGLAAAFAPTLSPLVIGAVAMGGGGLLQASINIGALRRDGAALRAAGGVVVLGAACVAAYPLAFYSSMRVGGVALGTVVSLASAPLASALLERALEHRALGTRWPIACGVGIAGSALMCLSHPGSGAGSSVPAGVGLGVLAGTAYAGYSWALRRLMSREVGRGAAAASVLGLGGVLLLPVAVAGSAAIGAAPATTWLVLAYLAAVPMCAGYVLFTRGLSGVDATTATTLTLVEPGVATALAVTVLAERLPVGGWVGMALLAVALAVLVAPAGLVRPGRRTRTPVPESRRVGALGSGVHRPARRAGRGRSVGPRAVPAAALRGAVRIRPRPSPLSPGGECVHGLAVPARPAESRYRSASG